MAERSIIFVSYGSYGDINPLLAVAQQLMAHANVIFAGNEFYRTHIEAAGVPFHAAGTIEEQLSCTETTALSGRSMAGLMHQFRVHVGMNIPRLSVWLEQLHATGNELLVVTHGTLNPAFPVCEKLAIPVVRAYLAPSHLPLNREDFILEQTFYGCPEWRARWIRYPRHMLNIRLHGPPHARREYDEYRVAAGAAPSLPPYQQFFARRLRHKIPQLNVVAELLLTPAWFAEPMGSEINHVHCTGFPFFEQPSVLANKQVEELIARHGAPVVFTPGTGMEDINEFCRPIESVCYKLRAPGILLARHGAGIFHQMQRVLNHPVIHVEFADMQWLLARAKLLVHVGGIGTIAQAVRAAVPQIISPVMHDQYGNALRVLQNGLGGMIYSGGYCSDDIVRIYNGLLSSEMHRDSLAYCTEQLRHEQGAMNAAHYLLECMDRIFSGKQKNNLKHDEMATSIAA